MSHRRMFLVDTTMTNEAGARCYRWADTAEVTCNLHKVSRGRYPVTVTFQGTAVTPWTVGVPRPRRS